MKTGLATFFGAFGVFALAFLAVPGENNPVMKTATTVTKPAKTKPTPSPNNEMVAKKNSHASNETTVVATNDYEIKIYGAFAFVPEDSFARFMKTDSGHRFVVLDMAVQNKSAIELMRSLASN